MHLSALRLNLGLLTRLRLAASRSDPLRRLSSVKSSSSSQLFQPSSPLPTQRVQDAIESVGTPLKDHGFAVVDGVFGTEWCRAWKDELAMLSRQKIVVPNHTFLVRDSKTVLLPKSNIEEMEMDYEPVRKILPNFCTLYDNDVMLSTFNNLIPGLNLKRQTIKLQINSGNGACFPLHFDSDEGLDGRCLTVLLYLNPEWQPAHGGQLRLYPFPSKPVDVEPLFDRLVVFFSPHVLHRVLPSTEQRFCFTTWLYGDANKKDNVTHQQPFLSANQEDVPTEVCNMIQGLPLSHRRHLQKALYKDEWAQSILESHPDNDDRQAFLDMHWKEVGIIEKALGQQLQVLRTTWPRT